MIIPTKQAALYGVLLLAWWCCLGCNAFITPPSFQLRLFSSSVVQKPTKKDDVAAPPLRPPRPVTAKTPDTVMERQVKPGATTPQGEVNWWQQWYPMAFVDDLDPKKPTAVELLGNKYVLWADKDQNWHCHLDKCPHRLAPLSEGRIDENGHLQCAYHGWSFKPNGECARIPQAEADIKIAAEGARRACVQSLPTRVLQGMVWIWPDTSNEGLANAMIKPPATVPELDDPTFVRGAWVVRDLEYNYDTLIENVVDPAHVPFAHHGVQGSRNQAMPMNISVRHTGPEGVFLALPRLANSTIEFHAPVLLRYKFDFSQFFSRIKPVNMVWNLEKKLRKLPEDTKPQSLLISYAIPRAPGRCRLLALFPRNHFILQKPRWIDHLERNDVLDGDLVFLHGQEREMRKPQHDWEESIDRAFYMPTRSDEGVRAFRHWLLKFGGGAPKWVEGMSGALPPLNPSREFLMDRYHQHTVHCSACRGALKNVRILKTFFSVLSLGLATAVWARPPKLALILAGSALSGLLSFKMKGLEQKFIYTDYVHATK